MRIDNTNTKVVFEFSPKDYFLAYNDDFGFSLNYKIDRSFKGKDDDVGLARIYLTEEEAEMCRKAGFSEVKICSKD